MSKDEHQMNLARSKLKVTPQRLAVLEALNNLKNHPTAENVKEYVILNHPNIAIGTIYKTLETFVEKGIIKMVKTEKDVMRYDSILEAHHHLYCENTETIEDYFDDELNVMLENYFKKKEIPNFEIKEIKLQINGIFK